MSLLKTIQTCVSGFDIKVNLPEKKTVILKGNSALHLLHITEVLLARDFTGYYWEKDKDYGFNYLPVDGMSYIEFNGGTIFGKDKIIQIQGAIPNIHVIRYLSGSNIRSFYTTEDSGNFQPIYTDMTKYSNIIPDSQWIRFITIANDIIGHEVYKFEDNNITHKFLEDINIPVEGQELIYLLLAECFLTPEGYHRVLLLPNIEYLSLDRQIRLLEVLDDFKGHTLTLSTANIDIKDISESSSLSFLYV